MDKTLADLTLDDIRRGIMDALAKEGKIRSDNLAYRVAEALSVRLTVAGGERFGRQVTFLSGQLVKQGQIRKVGRGEDLPDHTRSARYATYFSRAEYEAATTDEARSAELAREITARWDQVVIGMARHGFHMINRRMSLGDFERLLKEWPAEDLLAHRAEAALSFARRYGMTDGDHHKQWVIDQMMSALTDGAERLPNPGMAP